LPCEGTTHTFGQHPNVNITYLTRENNVLCKTLTYLQEWYNGPSDDIDIENHIMFKLSQMIQKIPMSIDLKIIFESIKTRRNIMDFILLNEVLF